MRRLSLRRAWAVFAALLTLTACVGQEDPGVAVRALQSDIVFGVTLPDEDAKPPGVEPPRALEGVVEEAPDEPAPPPTRPRPPQSPRPEAPTLECPFADVASPELIASRNVEGQPQQGTYRWKFVSTRNADGAARRGFVTRRILNVSDVRVTDNPVHQVQGSAPPKTETFTYDLETRFADGSRQVVTYQVKKNAAQVGQSPPVGNTTVQVGEDDRGLSIARVVNFDAAGISTTSFAPSRPVLLLPIEVNSNQQFQSVGVDPSGATLVHNATVLSRKTVDACGEQVDGWEVRSSEQFTDRHGTASATDYTYYVAPQLGGVLTYERIVPAGSTAPEGQLPPGGVELTLGQVDPGPL